MLGGHKKKKKDSMHNELPAKPMFVVVLALLTGLTAVAVAISLPAIPEMVSELGTTMSLGQQIVALFMLGMAIGQLPAGLLSDRLGRMPVTYAGVVLFTICGAVAALSNDITVILVARFAQGIGAAVGMVVSRAIVRDVASGATAARLMTLMVMIFTLGPMLAPMLGAFLAGQWGWRAPLHALAVIGLVTLFLVRTQLRETHVPSADQHIGHQFIISLKEFFSHREALFSVIIIMFTAAGFMVLITGSAALVIEIYEYPVGWFGAIFALTGVAMFAGSMISRQLLLRLGTVQVIGVGAGVVAVVAIQMLLIEWLGDVNFWWIWGNACLYMLGVGFLLPNANALALEPVPRIAGMASSIIGTMQGMAAAITAIVSSMLYDGTTSNLTLIMGAAGIAVLLTYLLHKPILGTVPDVTQEE
jgi:DHA1 family bicyclomycin/chloramphenicol resistance-like MFS transporter